MMSYNAAESVHADGYELGFADAVLEIAGELGITLSRKRKAEIEDLIAAMRATIPGLAEYQDNLR